MEKLFSISHVFYENLETPLTNDDGDVSNLTVRQGLAKMIIPCFVGDAYSCLEPCSNPMPELESERWIVVHQEQRQLPAIREAIDAITHFLNDHELVIQP